MRKRQKKVKYVKKYIRYNLGILKKKLFIIINFLLNSIFS